MCLWLLLNKRTQSRIVLLWLCSVGGGYLTRRRVLVWRRNTVSKETVEGSLTPPVARTLIHPSRSSRVSY